MKEDLSQQCAYYFINLMKQTNADSLKIKLDKVTLHGKEIGDYELIVKRVKGI